MSEEKNMMAEANEETAQITQNERVIDLGKPYKFEGTEYTSIDLSGLDKLTVKDAIDAQRQLFNEREVAAAMLCETTTAFARAIAARGQPQGGRCRAQLHERGCRDGEPRDAA